jgi:HTH-type transcriptional regulator/antitoxin HigA
MDRKPAEVRHPGEHLRDELIARGWDYMELSHIVGYDASFIADICREKQDIVPEIAERLSKALGTSADYWLNLQREWDEFQERSK